MSQVIVAWTTKKTNAAGHDKYKDHWTRCDAADGQKKYEKLLKKRSTYIASICKVVQSTDYEVD